MKLINLILLLLPLTGFSQVTGFTYSNAVMGCDTVRTDIDSFVIGNCKVVGNKVYTKVLPKPTLWKIPEIPKNIGVTTVKDTIPPGVTTPQSLDYYNGTLWFNHITTEVVKGKVETPVNVMDSGMKVEVVETRDTIYKCPYSNISLAYFTYDYNVSNTKAQRSSDCTLEKIVTTRRYKLYIINEYGQKEYLSMELTKQK